jgi:hypothetical protein
MTRLLKTDKVFFEHFARELPEGLGTAGVGEERWAMNIAEYCLQEGYEVYTKPGTGIWRAPYPPPSNFHPQTLPPGDDVTVFGQPYGITVPAKLEVYLLFDGPHRSLSFTGNRVLVHSYRSGVRFNGMKRLYKDQNFYFLPHLVDIQHSGDNFHRLNIFWTSKSHFQPCSQSLLLPEVVVEWVSRQMSADKRITFAMTTMTHGKSYQQAREEVRSSPLFQTYLAKFGKRVVLKGYMSYQEVKDTLAKSKMIINLGNFGHTYGGSSIEAACYGIPSIQYQEGPFATMPGVIVRDPNDAGGYIQELDRLFHNKAYYKRKAEQYQKFARTVYERENWEKVINKIVQRHSR